MTLDALIWRGAMARIRYLGNIYAGFLLICAGSCAHEQGSDLAVNDTKIIIVSAFQGSNRMFEELQPVFDLFEANRIKYSLESNCGVDSLSIKRKDLKRAIALLKTSSLLSQKEFMFTTDSTGDATK
jgi:hypothetical protein